MRSKLPASTNGTALGARAPREVSVSLLVRGEILAPVALLVAALCDATTMVLVRPSRLVEGVLDETAHVMTAALLLAALRS